MNVNEGSHSQLLLDADGRTDPVVVEPGDEVIGATLNTTGTFVMRATRVGRDTALARIVDLVGRAQGSKAPIQRLADRVAEVFVPIVLIVASATFVLWFLGGPEPRVTFALTAFVSVLVIACPCAMGLATPTAIMVGTGRGAEAGILIRGGEALETAHRVTAVVMDKTGTLTLGRPVVETVTPAPGSSVAEVLDAAGALEKGSEHPLAAAILTRAREDELGFPAVADFAAIAGAGVVGPRGGRRRADAQRSLSATGGSWLSTASTQRRWQALRPRPRMPAERRSTSRSLVLRRVSSPSVTRSSRSPRLPYAR